MRKIVPLEIDSKKGHEVAKLLYKTFRSTGIHGQTEMPEDILPTGVIRGSLEHTLFITLTAAIDYQRNADGLWKSSRKTFEDPSTRYLYDLRSLYETPMGKIITDMQTYRLSRKPKKDAVIWKTVGVSFYKKWEGDPRKFLQDCEWDAVTVLCRLKTDFHTCNNIQKSDFPYLRGEKIGPLWLRMLRDNVGISTLRNLDHVPIPVDIHIARATLALGVVRGNYSGTLEEIYKSIRKAWFASVQNVKIDNRSMTALDIDEPLWHLGW